MKTFLNSKSRQVVRHLLLILAISVIPYCGGGSGVISSSTTTTSSSDAGKIIVSGGSDVNASVVVGKDALPADAVVSLAQGKEVLAQDSDSFATLTQATVRSQGQSVVISSTANVDPGQPMQLQIPLPSTGLALAERVFGLTDNTTISIAYKIIDYTKKEMRIGIIPYSKITIQGSNAIFSSSYFGVFQSIITDTPITETKEVAVNTPILAANGKVLIDVPSASSSSTDTSQTTNTSSTAAPLAASLFGVYPGTATQGDIYVKITWASDATNNAKAEVRALLGTSAPDAACTGSSDIIVGTISDFSSTTSQITFNSGSTNGSIYSFRLCIYGKNSKLTSTDTVLSAASLDTIPPPPLVSFTATRSSASDPNATITWTYPADVSDYSTMYIRSITGNAPPAPNNCGSGTPVGVYTAPFVSQQITTSATVGTGYGYRACIYDANGNLTNSNATTLNVSDYQLTAFSGAAGSANAGDINLFFTWPTTASSISYVYVLRLPASTGLIPQCDYGQGEELVINYQGPLTAGSNVTYLDQRNTLLGEAFNYRACVLSNSVLVNSSPITSIPSRPAASQIQSANYVTSSFLIPPPANVPLTKVELYKKSGTTSVDCFASPSTNTTYLRQSWINFTGITLIDSDVSVPSGTYSYTYCVTFPSSPTLQIDLPLTIIP